MDWSLSIMAMGTASVMMLVVLVAAARRRDSSVASVWPALAAFALFVTIDNLLFVLPPAILVIDLVRDAVPNIRAERLLSECSRMRAFQVSMLAVFALIIAAYAFRTLNTNNRWLLSGRKMQAATARTAAVLSKLPDGGYVYADDDELMSWPN